MYVRIKLGHKAGEILDVRDQEAKLMIADGRAADPRDEDEAQIILERDKANGDVVGIHREDKKTRKARKG